MATSNKNTKTVKTTKAVTPAVAATQALQIKTELNLSNSDLVCLVTSKVEETLKGHLRTIRRDIKDTSAKVKVLTDEIEEGLKVLAEVAVSAHKAILLNFLMAWGLADKDGYAISNGASLRIDTEPMEATAVGVNQKADGKSFAYLSAPGISIPSHVAEIKLTLELEAKQKELKALQDTIQSLSNKEHLVNCKLADMPNLERKAMTALTRKALEASELGQEYAGKLDSVIAGLGLGLEAIEEELG